LYINSNPINITSSHEVENVKHSYLGDDGYIADS